jgi:hypothetical protein
MSKDKEEKEKEKRKLVPIKDLPESPQEIRS